jgi:hypothetical protein
MERANDYDCPDYDCRPCFDRTGRRAFVLLAAAEGKARLVRRHPLEPDVTILIIGSMGLGLVLLLTEVSHSVLPLGAARVLTTCFRLLPIAAEPLLVVCQ